MLNSLIHPFIHVENSFLKLFGALFTLMTCQQHLMLFTTWPFCSWQHFSKQEANCWTCWDFLKSVSSSLILLQPCTLPGSSILSCNLSVCSALCNQVSKVLQVKFQNVLWNKAQRRDKFYIVTLTNNWMLFSETKYLCGSFRFASRSASI